MNDNNFITLMSFSNYLDAAPIKSLLDSEGVACYLRDEHIVTNDPLIVNAVGGIKLDVSKNDYRRAKQLLLDTGYKFPEEADGIPPFWDWFDHKTKWLPFLGNKVVGVRFFVLLCVVVLTLLSFLVWINRPSVPELITSNSWCVDKIYYNGSEIVPNTINSIELVINDGCDEDIYFRDNGNVQLPGINSPSVYGYWRYDADSERLVVENVDTLSDIYEGNYRVEINGVHLTLSSEQLIIYCTRIAHPFGL